MFSLPVLSVFITTITLLRLQPWGGDTAPPPPGPPPSAIGVGETLALPGAHGASPRVADASPVRGVRRERAAARPVERGRSGAGAEPAGTSPLAIAPAHAVAVAVGGAGEFGPNPAASKPAPMPIPAAVAAPSPPPLPAPAPPATGGGSPGAPIRAVVVPEPICEGDEGTIGIPVEEVGDAGGDLANAGGQAIQLFAAGSCVAMPIPGESEEAAGTEEEDAGDDEGEASAGAFPLEQPSP